MIAWRLVHKPETTWNHESTNEGVDTGLKALYQASQFWVWEMLVSTFALDGAIFSNLSPVCIRLCATVDCRCQWWCHIHAAQLLYISPLSSKWNDDISEVYTQKGFNEAEKALWRWEWRKNKQKIIWTFWTPLLILRLFSSSNNLALTGYQCCCFLQG